MGEGGKESQGLTANARSTRPIVIIADRAVIDAACWSTRASELICDTWLIGRSQ